MADKRRIFQECWTDKFFVREVEGRPVCLICNKAQTHNKLCNITRHYNTTHGDFDTRYPRGTERRKEKLTRLLSNAEQGEKLLRGKPSEATTAATLASYKVAFELGKNMAPLAHSELIKTCMLSTVETLFPNKPKIKAAIEKVPLSRQTTTRRVEEIGEEINRTTLQELMECDCFSLALDETNDIGDTAQLAVFVRYSLNNNYHERLLTLLSLKGRATGAIIFEAFETFMRDSNLPWSKIISVATDGAPAMVGKHSGFVKYLKDKCPNLLACHCIIHDTVLCAKLSDKYAELMTTAMKMINFLRSQSGLRHRQLKAFLQEMGAEYSDLLTYNSVRLVHGRISFKHINCEI